MIVGGYYKFFPPLDFPRFANFAAIYVICEAGYWCPLPFRAQRARKTVLFDNQDSMSLQQFPDSLISPVLIWLYSVVAIYNHYT